MPKKAATKEATFNVGLIERMKLVLAHQRGEVELEQVRPKPTSVRRPFVRDEIGASFAFASALPTVVS
jgi:hypothetical protein